MAEKNNLDNNFDKENLINLIKSLKCKFPNSSIMDLFKKACLDLNYSLKIYFREDISSPFLYSCQIIINHNKLNKSVGETENIALKNALYTNFENSRMLFPLFTEDISDNIYNIEICDYVINCCREYFSKRTYSKINRINYNNIKDELENIVGEKLILSETYYFINNQWFCCIFLNEELLLQQGCAQDKTESLENALTNLFASYSIFPEVIKQSDQVTLNVNDLLFNLNQYLKQKNIKTDYFNRIKEYMEKLKLKINIGFNNGNSFVKINGVQIAEARHSNEYCAYILLCQELLHKINKATCDLPNPKQNAPIQTKEKGKKSLTISKKDLNVKFREIAKKADVDHQSDETRSYWSIVNSLFLKEKIQLEPHYSVDRGTNYCTLNYRYLKLGGELCQEEGNKQESSREAAAKEFIRKYTSK